MLSQVVTASTLVLTVAVLYDTLLLTAEVAIAHSKVDDMAACFPPPCWPGYTSAIHTVVCVGAQQWGEGNGRRSTCKARVVCSPSDICNSNCIHYVCVCPPHSPAAHHLWWRCVCVHVFNTVVTHTSCNHRQQSGGGMTRDRRMASTACCVRHPRWLCDPFLHHCGMLWHVEERQGVAGPTSARGVVNIQHG